MPRTKEQKQTILRKIKDCLSKQKSVVFVDFTGLKVKEFTQLRKDLKQIGAHLMVGRKTLLQKAFKEKGFEVDFKKMPGEIAAMFAFEDLIEPAKSIYKFSKSHEKLRIRGGIFENRLRDAKDVIEIAKLPLRQELLGRIVKIFASPLSGFVNVLQGNIKGLICVLANVKKNN